MYRRNSNEYIVIIIAFYLLSLIGQTIESSSYLSKCNNSCADPNQVCLDHICLCAPNFKYNTKTQICEYFKCSDHSECNAINYGSYCIKGDCQCNPKYFVPDHRNGEMCIPFYCQSREYCTEPNTACIDSQCICTRNHYYNRTTLRCEFMKCTDTVSCGAYDNTICSSGQCICKPGYFSDISNGDKCVLGSQSYGKQCVTLCGSDGEKCVDNECKCAPNYRYDQNLGKCVSFTCKESYECQTYDSNRVCLSGSCQCEYNSMANDNNGGKCSCAPNYSYNRQTAKCEFIECQTTKECQDLDENKVCNERYKCVCAQGYHQSVDQQKCIDISSNYSHYCDSQQICKGLGEICVNQLCSCAPDYRYNKKLGKCETYFCQTSDECQTYDKNRVCLSGSCKCNTTNRLVAIDGGLCALTSATFQKFCSTDDSCHEPNQRCVDNVCRCAPNYIFDDKQKLCQLFNCTDSPYVCSNSYDLMRHCDEFGSCVCDTHYTEDKSNGKRCKLNYFSTYDNLWLYILIPCLVVPIIIWIIVGFNIAKLLNIQKRPVSLQSIQRNDDFDCNELGGAGGAGGATTNQISNKHSGSSTFYNDVDQLSSYLPNVKH